MPCSVTASRARLTRSWTSRPRPSPLGSDADRLVREAHTLGLRRKRPRGVLLLGPPGRPPSPTTRTPRARAPPWSSCTPAPSCTTTTWTPRTPGGCRRRTGSSPPSTVRRVARATRAVRRRGRHPCSATCCQLVRRAARRRRPADHPRSRPRSRSLDRCRPEVIAGQFLDVSVQARGRADVETAMTVLRHKSALLHRALLHIGATWRGPRRGRSPSCPASAALARRGSSSCATTCSASSGDPGATGKPAGDDLVGRASGPCWSRWP